MKNLFTVEYDKKGEMVGIHLNNIGIDQLILTLQQLKKSTGNEHSHLMTKAWGGDELSDELQNSDSNIQLINHLKIFYWKD